METASTNENGRFSWRSLSKRIFRSKSLSYVQTVPSNMPSCVPATHNNVSDVNANITPPNANQDSKLQKIMACLFWKKKTDVVDMKKDQKAVAKKKMAVDRSERSRRVLQMEAMKDTPKSRTEGDAAPSSPGANQMFLPSENPTSSFLSYLNPSVRRACSDVIRTNSTTTSNGAKGQTREAFVDSDYKPPLRTRNTSYRAHRVTDRDPPIENPDRKPWELDRPPRLPERTQSQKPAGRQKPIVVPGTMACSDDDIGYNSDNEISDLQDELCRMNMSQPDLRYPSNGGNVKRRRREGTKSSSDHSGSLSREGSISLSEGSSSDEENPVVERPQNPSPGQQKRKVFHKVPTDHPREAETEKKEKSTAKRGPVKTKSMENSIDELFIQTQQNIDHIYRNGLDNMDLETYRSGTATPETCMKRMDTDLFKPTVNERELSADANNGSNRTPRESQKNTAIQEVNKMQVTDIESAQDAQEMDSLLTEVSIWAKDRQNWLLEDGKHKSDTSKERTQSSLATDDRVISVVTKTNKDRCSEWVDSVGKPENRPVDSETKPVANGILTGPKLFRSSSRNTNSRKVSFSDNDSNVTCSVRDVSTKGSVLTVASKDIDDKLSRDGTMRVESYISKNTEGPEPWSSEMYTKTNSGSHGSDRSTINDNLSELDQRAPFRARSPDSWLSSTGSCSHVLKPEIIRDDKDSFGTASPFQNTPDPTTVKRTASEPAKSHQIIRKKPVIHAPFAAFDRQHIPMPNENPFNPMAPLKPIGNNGKNTQSQLKPLSMQLHQFPGLRSNAFAGTGGSRNYKDFEPQLSSMQSPRPFSEIPVRESFGAKDRMMATNNGNAAARSHSEVTTSIRPNSETMPVVKRNSKIGAGNVMATDSMKERNKYARDIVNSFSKPRPVISMDAFKNPAVEALPEPEHNQEGKQKKHKVFNQKLMNGGYSYEKHSRRQPMGNKEFLDLTEGYYDPNEQTLPELHKMNGHPKKANGIPSTRGGINATSVSELSVNVRDSYDGTYGMRPAVMTKESMNQLFSGNKNTMDIHIGASYNDAEHQTAEKFKRLRSRRDQEMDWLMKDAAETEV